jgi:Mg2+ and Co2+ transporter CorA
MVLSLEIYEFLEEEVGKEKAKKIVNTIEILVNQEKDIIKSQLKQELSNELITKGEFYSETKRIEDTLRVEIKRVEDRIDTVVDRINTLEKLFFVLFGGLLLPMILILIKLYIK